MQPPQWYLDMASEADEIIVLCLLDGSCYAPDEMRTEKVGYFLRADNTYAVLVHRGWCRVEHLDGPGPKHLLHLTDLGYWVAQTVCAGYFTPKVEAVRIRREQQRNGL